MYFFLNEKWVKGCHLDECMECKTVSQHTQTHTHFFFSQCSLEFGRAILLGKHEVTRDGWRQPPEVWAGFSPLGEGDGVCAERGGSTPQDWGGRPRAGVKCSAHLLPCGSGRQDVQLGELSRVFLGLEAQRGNTWGPAVCWRGRGGGGGRWRVGEDGAGVRGVLHRRGGLTEERCSCGSTGQGTHTGEKPGGTQKTYNLKKNTDLLFYLSLHSLVHYCKNKSQCSAFV